jgi:hypothetical protein
MATEHTSTAFAEPAQSPYVKDVSGSGVDVTADTNGSMPSSKSYQLVKSPTGNMYVEVSFFRKTCILYSFGKGQHNCNGDLSSGKVREQPTPSTLPLMTLLC